MKNTTLKQIMKEINKQIDSHSLGELPYIRKEILGLSKIPSKSVFPQPKAGKDYLFHIGGRKELQFNIGVNKEERSVRFGVAYSITRDISLQNIDDLRPSIENFNNYIDSHPPLLKGKIMTHTGSKDYKPRFITEDLIVNNTFVFLGMRQSFDNLDYAKALDCLDDLLPLYIMTISGVSGKSIKPKSPRARKKPSVENLRIVNEDEESMFPEGGEIYRLHRSLERDRTISKRAKIKRKTAVGALRCDVCDFDFNEKYGILGDGFIEAHHTIPVASLRGKTRTQIMDIALVCANCHRMLHTGPRLLSVDELKNHVRKSNPH